MKLLLILLAAWSVTGCAGMDVSKVGVEPGENAFSCIRINIDPSFTDSGASIKTVEGPEDGKLTVDDAAKLLAAC